MSRDPRSASGEGLEAASGRGPSSPGPGQPIVHRYLQRGTGGFVNLSLTSAERIFISVAKGGFRAHRLVFWGRLPGRTLYVADAGTRDRIVAVLARDIDRLPKLPEHAEMMAFLVNATAALTDPGFYGSQPKDENGDPTTELAVLTRAALAEPDAAALVRRLERASMTAGGRSN